MRCTCDNDCGTKTFGTSAGRASASVDSWGSATPRDAPAGWGSAGCGCHLLEYGKIVELKTPIGLLTSMTFSLFFYFYFFLCSPNEKDKTIFVKNKNLSLGAAARSPQQSGRYRKTRSRCYAPNQRSLTRRASQSPRRGIPTRAGRASRRTPSCAGLRSSTAPRSCAICTAGKDGPYKR